ncbi:methanogen output domain 1-containing protein [Wenxinia saemankumensis]|uniref:Metanogen output domain-containing protein n=1 Tax=Wenxinia saemankumensis TaxID=1447782 RepID=A0A1M6DYU9_9RHOB|nr:methanogen output domain 1-containing protein [Wenxinia saemankumensis]SHI78313.1 hypothetical protein SAMN05444417_1685 [Wenxinia saemankumensis]
MLDQPDPRAATGDDDRTGFLHDLITDLATVLEENLGIEEAEGLIALVGARTGRAFDAEYRDAAGTPRLDPDAVAGALVDLKRRIGAGFRVVDIDETAIVLTNDRCPFHRGSEALCMMTSNVFGRIAADNLGYARVDLQETILRGAGACRVVIDLVPGQAGRGREYFG